jgi:non-ribosomal peptide synthetase component F
MAIQFSTLQEKDEPSALVVESEPANPEWVAARQAQRSIRLSRGLIRLGLQPGETVGVLVCHDHMEDLRVATESIARSGGVALEFGVDGPSEDLEAQLQRVRGGLLLMCAEGVSIWRATGIPMRAVGDGPDMVWWRALERRPVG